MKKLILLIMAAMLIIGCSDGDTTTTQLTTLADTTTTQAQQTTTTMELTQDVQNLVNKANNIATLGFVDASSKNKYTIIGNKMKVELFDYYGTKDDERYTVVFLDMDEKKAYAACINDNLICAEEVRKVYWEVDYDTYIIKTPIDYMNSIASATINEKRTKRFDGADTVSVEFTDKSKSAGSMFVSPYYGIPYEINIDGRTIVFDQVVVNKYSDDAASIPEDYNPR